MSDNQLNDQDIRLVKLGGLSGILSGIILILAMAFVAIVIGAEDHETLAGYRPALSDSPLYCDLLVPQAG